MKKLFAYIFYTTALVIGLSFVLNLNAPSVEAAPDGRLIDDSVFDNSGTMSAEDIQNFLNQFPNSCLRSYSDALPSGDPTRAYFDYGGSASAATIIRRVADIYGVNPRVILSKLQQEQSLVTGNAGCSGWRYTGAMGFNCPDGQSCPVNPANAGFSRQVTRGTWLLKIGKERAIGNLNWLVPDDAVSYTYGGPMTQGVRKRCASCPAIYYDGVWNGIYLESGATASLYNYTPHVPSSFDNIHESWWGTTFGGSWNAESLDGSIGSVHPNDAVLGGSPDATQFGADLHVFYYDNTVRALRWAKSSASGWSFNILDGAGGQPGSSSANVGQNSKAIVYAGSLHVFYYDVDNGNLKHAWSSNGISWQFETLDGSGGVNGRISSNLGQSPSVVQHGQELHMFYYDVTNKALRHGWLSSDGTTWTFGNLEGGANAIRSTNADVGKYSSVASYQNTLQLFYYDVTHGNLRHAWANTNGWNFENLDGDAGSVARNRSNADLGHFSTVAVYGNTLQLFYYDVTHGNLRHAWANTNGWNFENLDGDAGSIARFNSDVGLNPTVTIHDGQLQLYYYERANGGRLRHMWTNPAFGWLAETLDGAPPSVVGWRSDNGTESVVTTYNGGLQLFYNDATVGDLRHAWPR